MQLDILRPDDAPAASRPLLAGIAEDLGVVPNLAAVTAASPTLLTAFDALRRAVADPGFPADRREVAGVAVGVAVDNEYGVAFHSTVLHRLGVDSAEIAAMRSGEEPSDPVLAAVYAFAREIVLARGKVSDDVVRRAMSVGLTSEELLQLVTECTFAGLVGTVDNLAGRVPLDDFLQPQRWSR